MALSRSVATPWKRYSIAGLFLLILLGAIILQIPRPTPSFVPSPRSASAQEIIVPSPVPIGDGTEQVVPVPALLAPAPTNCPLFRAPDSMTLPNNWGNFQSKVTLIGQGKIWLFDKSNSLIPSSDEIFHANSQGYTPWPAIPIVWEVGPDKQTSQVVTVQVTDQDTGKLVWWDPQGQNPEQTLHLIYKGPNYTGDPEPGWHEWATELLILQAGCYIMQVNAPGEQWLLSFAAGR